MQITPTQAKKINSYLRDVGNRCNRTYNGASNILRILGIKPEILEKLTGEDHENPRKIEIK